MKSLEKFKEEVNSILSSAVDEQQDFPTTVERVKSVILYGYAPPMHVVLGVIGEYIEIAAKTQKIKATMEDEKVQEAYDNMAQVWNTQAE
mgnify:CR=1 FL=1|tara:strand:- start:3859 stop:4128 length:270 start_codon:yes stop_codon:yes gene_type:complete